MTPGGSPRPVLSIRWIVACAAAVLTVLVVLSVTAVMERRMRTVLAHEIETRLLLQARNLALAGSNALLTEFPELTLAPLLKETQERQPELALIAVLDRSGNIAGGPDVRLLGTPFRPPTDLEPVPTDVPLKPRESLTANRDILLVTAPILHRDGELLGTVMVGLSRGYIDRAATEVRKQQHVILGGFLLAGIVASFILMSILLRPFGALRAGIERIGRGDWDTPLELKDRTEFGLLADAVNTMSRALKKAQGEMLERERLAHEMDLAKQIQRSFLPARQTVAGGFVIEGEQWAAAEVGGDYYDALSFPDGKIALAVADVSGKGLAGCLVTSMMVSLLRALRFAHASPSSLLIALDERLAEVLQRGNFVTMFYGVLDPESGRLVYSSAGHSPLLVYRRATRRAEWFYTKGIPLGAICGGAIRGTLEDSVLQMDPGDLLVQFTDGINEATDPAGRDQFGFERMEQVVIDAAPRGARSVLTALHQAVLSWRGSGMPLDDETVLIVSREGAQAAAPASSGREPQVSASLELLAEARARGPSLSLPASLNSLPLVDDWLLRSGVLEGVSSEDAGLLALALYEVGANIVEHGYGSDASRTFEIWWVPAPRRAPSPRAPGGGNGMPDPRGDARSPRGFFIIQDRGSSFRPAGWKPADFGDAEVRKRGRGFGLDIIHKVMGEVTYHPGTEAGNITVLRWDASGVPVDAGERRDG